MNQLEFYLEDLKSKFNKINANEYYLAYSGGRDSELLRVFIKEYLKLNIPIISVNTKLEIPEIHKRMNLNADKILISKLDIYDVRENFGIPCYSKQHDEYIFRYQNGSRSINTMNYIDRKNKALKLTKEIQNNLYNGKLNFKISNRCCTIIKEKPMIDFGKKTKLKAIIGTRSAESNLRKFKGAGCFKANGNFTPIHDLDNDLMIDIEKYLNIQIPDVYNKVNRTGCSGCPYGKTPLKELSLIQPRRADFIYNCFKDSYNIKGLK